MEELTKSQFAMNLRNLMQKRHLTGAALATKAKLSKSAVSNYVGGKAVPNLESRKALAKALGVGVEVLAPVDSEALDNIARWKFESQGGKAYVTLSGVISLEAALEINKIVAPFLPDAV